MKKYVLGGLIGLYALTGCAKLENESFQNDKSGFIKSLS